MPLRWERGRNPYVDTYFARLSIGPNLTPPQIAQRARQIKQTLVSRPIEVGGRPLDEHAVSEATTKLMKDPPALAQELLLVHALPRDERGKLAKVCEDLRQAATVPEQPSPLPLKHALSVFWFVPSPGPEAAALPPWEAFGFVEAGEAEDLALDIEFDG